MKKKKKGDKEDNFFSFYSHLIPTHLNWQPEYLTTNNPIATKVLDVSYIILLLSS